MEHKQCPRQTQHRINENMCTASQVWGAGRKSVMTELRKNVSVRRRMEQVSSGERKHMENRKEGTEGEGLDPIKSFVGEL